MYLKYITLLCFIHFTSGFSFKDVLDFSLIRSRKHVADVSPAKPACVVSTFGELQNLNLQKLDGVWFEVFRTPSSIPYRHGIWRFQSNTTDQIFSNFNFAAKDRNDTCISPLSGTMQLDESSPSTVNLDYRGAKGKFKEVFKVLFTDYTHSCLLYACHHVDSEGRCSPEASTLLILVRKPTLDQSVFDHLKKESRKVCIESSTLIQQNGEEPCPLDQVDSRPWSKLDEDIACETTSSCALACPKCCREQEDGCVRCHCHSQEQDKQDDCVYSLADCAGNKCQLKLKRPGCYQCDCSVFLKAAALTDTSESPISKINNTRECPTTCRTAKVDQQLYCNCSNLEMCKPIPPNVPNSCKDKIERFYFDNRSGTCHAFYGSCLPDKNNFRSLQECIGTCADICLLPLNNGQCKGNVKEPVTRYFFNRNRGICDTFKYGGCDGNTNNFESMEICKHHCPEWMDKPESNRRPDICYQGVEKGHCYESHIRYFYLNVTRTCTSFIYSGCGKNDNHFEKLSQCEQTCIGNPANQHPCPTLGKCPCDTKVNEDYCIVCPCEGEDDDDCDDDDDDDCAGTSLQWYSSLMVSLLSFLWIAPRRLF